MKLAGSTNGTYDGAPFITATENRDELSVRAATYVLEVANEAIRKRGRAIIALAGGSTPIGTYARLAHPPYRDQTDWSSWRFIFGDERMVPLDHQERNARMARSALLDRSEFRRARFSTCRPS